MPETSETPKAAPRPKRSSAKPAAMPLPPDWPPAAYAAFLELGAAHIRPINEGRADGLEIFAAQVRAAYNTGVRPRATD